MYGQLNLPLHYEKTLLSEMNSLGCGRSFRSANGAVNLGKKKIMGEAKM